MKTQNTTVAFSSKASKNTPVIASFETYVAKVTDSKKAAALKEAHKAAQAKKETKPVQKKGVFALVAGTIVSFEHKAFKKAIAYHVTKGNLEKTPSGIKLTNQGASIWAKDRQLADSEKFQAIAGFMHSGKECPKEWMGQPITKVNASIQFPNMLYWGSFSTAMMRQAFAAIWAK